MARRGLREDIFIFDLAMMLVFFGASTLLFGGTHVLIGVGDFGVQLVWSGVVLLVIGLGVGYWWTRPSD